MPTSREPGRRGRRPKGTRVAFSFKLPKDHRRQYEHLAAARGLPLGDYLALKLAEVHGLDEPDYISRQDQLPMAG